MGESRTAGRPRYWGYPLRSCRAAVEGGPPGSSADALVEGAELLGLQR